MITITFDALFLKDEKGDSTAFVKRNKRKLKNSEPCDTEEAIEAVSALLAKLQGKKNSAITPVEGHTGTKRHRK